MVGVGYLHLGFELRAAEAIEHDLLDALAHFGVVAVARHVDEQRVEALKWIAPRKQRTVRRS